MFPVFEARVPAFKIVSNVLSSIKVVLYFRIEQWLKIASITFFYTNAGGISVKKNCNIIRIIQYYFYFVNWKIKKTVANLIMHL